MSARPFRVGDRVRISGWGSHGPHEGTVIRIDPADLAGKFGPYISTDCRYTADSGAPAIACAAMTDDLTAGLGCTVELIESADVGEDDVDRVDPEDPTSMVVPVPGDQVLMADGGTARVAARRMGGDVLSLQVQRPRMSYAEWVGVEAIVGVPEPEVVGPTAVSSQAGLSAIRHGVVQSDTAAAVVTAALAWEESYDQPSGTHSVIRTGHLMGAIRAHRAAIGGAS